MTDTSDRVYDYLCCYLDVWIEPPSLEDIGKSLSLRPREVIQALLHLDRAHRLEPDSLMPRGYLTLFRRDPSADGAPLPGRAFLQDIVE